MIYWSKSSAGFFDSTIHGGSIPADAVEVTSDQHISMLSALNNGKTVAIEGGELSISEPVLTAAELTAAKASLLSSIDRVAEEKRAQYITPGAGQAMAYIEKARQAADYLAASNPVSDDYPLLVAEVGITGDTVSDVATTIDAAYRQWIVIGGKIEATRLAGKKAIAAAADLDLARSAYEAIEWPEVE